jgi:hypothetical protein
MTPAKIDGEEERPTDVPGRQRERPRAGELHGADDPWGWADNRGATLRTVRREP